MSSSASEEEVLMYAPYDRWNASAESILTQKIGKLTKSESFFKLRQYSPSLTFSQLELREIHLKSFREKAKKWEVVQKKCRFPKIIQTRSLLRDELEILKINMSMHEKVTALRESQLLEAARDRERKGQVGRRLMKLMNEAPLLQKFGSSKVKDLLSEIDGSELAKTDKVTWKFLKRGHSIRKEAINAKKFVLQVQTLYLPDCVFLQMLSTYSVIPFIYVHCVRFISGFVPLLTSASGKENYKNPTNLTAKLNYLTKYQAEKMVSASSTSAKNLFVESKLRLSDRVQVNVNNIAAVARQIQRGSKANENLMTAAKNFALQEAAIENSETNLKKLKLLTTHLNNQLDSLHNSSQKIEVVLEQVCSMQR